MNNDLTAIFFAGLSVLVSISSIAGFIIARMKDAEQRGRQAERIDKLESQLKAHEENVVKKFDKNDLQFEKVLDKLEKISSDLRTYADTHVQVYHREGNKND